MAPRKNALPDKGVKQEKQDDDQMTIPSEGEDRDEDVMDLSGALTGEDVQKIASSDTQT